MNERIQELAEQAGIHFHKGGTLDAGPNGIAKFVLYSDMEKFAELIVKECIDIVSPYAIRMENFDGGHPIADLKKHFGVES